MRRRDSEHWLKELLRWARAMVISTDTRDGHEMLRLLLQSPRSLVYKHRSLSTPPLPRVCVARHCQGAMIQGQLPWENTQCAAGHCNIMLASATTGSPCIPYPSLPPAWVSQSPLISDYFNPILSERRTVILRWPTGRGGAKSKAEPQELCKQRREREISPCSLRRRGLNLHNKLDVPCICGIPE